MQDLKYREILLWIFSDPYLPKGFQIIHVSGKPPNFLEVKSIKFYYNHT